MSTQAVGVSPMPSSVRGHKRASEGGGAAVEAVVVIPVAMVVLLFAVQGCLWAHATSVADYAAAQGAEIGSLAGSSPQAGVDRARSVLTTLGSSVISGPEVQSKPLPGGNLEMHVSGYLETFLPGIRLPVSAERVAVVQTFRSDR